MTSSNRIKPKPLPVEQRLPLRRRRRLLSEDRGTGRAHRDDCEESQRARQRHSYGGSPHHHHCLMG